jgi:hypothetical protein
MANFRFPDEFSQMLTNKGLSFLRGTDNEACYGISKSPVPFVLLNDVIKPRIANECVRMLDRELYPHLRTINSPIPADSISAMDCNYSELLPKTLHVKTAFFQSKTSNSYAAGVRMGLLQMMRSQSMAAFAETVLALPIDRAVGCQVFCYRHGDYVGPHNDHFPENEALNDGYVDLHVMLTNSAVFHHWLVYEDRRHFSRILNVNVNAVALYRLPFWHFTTPLVGLSGREEEARRWVLLTTFALRRKRSK